MFDPAAHQKFLDSIRAETEKFMVERNAAGKAEGERENGLLQEWRDRKAAEALEDTGALSVDDGMSDMLFLDLLPDQLLAGAVLLDLVSPMTASLWKVLVTVGEAVKAGQTLAILEAMKMEIRTLRVYLRSPADLRLVHSCSCGRGYGWVHCDADPRKDGWIV